MRFLAEGDYMFDKMTDLLVFTHQQSTNIAMQGALRRRFSFSRETTSILKKLEKICILIFSNMIRNNAFIN